MALFAHVVCLKMSAKRVKLVTPKEIQSVQSISPDIWLFITFPVI